VPIAQLGAALAERDLACRVLGGQPLGLSRLAPRDRARSSTSAAAWPARSAIARSCPARRGGELRRAATAVELLAVGR
jgi:hypothetical protein